MFSDISIEPFRGDVEGLEQMAHYSWRQEYGVTSFPNFYRPAFLRFLFDRIQDKQHLIAAYRGDEIVSFLANLPQRLHFDGNTYRATYSCLMVTRKQLLREGLGKAIINEALRLNQDYRYDFSLFTLERGHRSALMVQKFKETGYPVEWVKRMCIVARILDLGRVSASEGLKRWERAGITLLGAHRQPRVNPFAPVREYRPEDLPMCLALLNQYQKRVRLALLWDREELACELAWPGVSQTLVYEKEGKIAALINFIYHEHLGKTREWWGWLNHVAYQALSARERLAFVRGFLSYLANAGCVGAIELTKKYYPMAPLFRARFIPYFRTINMFSWTFNPSVTLKDIPDVYEVQI